MIVGISGKIGHGKDVIAQYLVREHGFVIVRMSDALKNELLQRMPRTLDAIARLNGIKVAVHGDSSEAVLRSELVYDIKPRGIRELLQEYGTEVRRQDDPDYWVKRWKIEAAKHRRVVVPDVRFLNEAEAIRTVSGRNGVLWRVQRPGLPSTGTHASEQFVDEFTDWDANFVNNGTIEALEACVAEYLAVPF